MEVVRKKICFDKLLSHRNGIVPYILKDNEDTSINYVNTISSQSNYNSFPCDFALIDSHVVFDKETGLSYRENIEVSRLRYLDVISWYNEIVYHELDNWIGKNYMEMLVKEGEGKYDHARSNNDVLYG